VLILVLLTAAFDLLVILVIALAGHGFGHAVGWSTSQLLVGGSSQASGRLEHVIEPILQIWSVTAVAALAGSLGAFFHRRSIERRPLRVETRDVRGD